MTSRPLAAALVAGVAVEVVALVGGALWMVWQVVAGRSQAAGFVVGLAVVALVAAAVLALAARALVRAGSGPARGWVVTWQLLQAGSAGTVLGAGQVLPAAVAGAAVAAVLAVGVVAAAVADAWRAHRDADGGGRS